MHYMVGGLAALGLVAGCESVPPGVEQGPHGTIAYQVSITASEPDVRIEANGQDIGVAPVKLKIFGDKDGTFHDFGSYYYIIRAIPNNTNSFEQVRYFRTGKMFTPEDHVPREIYFDMSKRPPENAPGGVYGSPNPPPYYGPYPYPYPYPGPYYYGPRIYIGPYGGHYYHHW